MGVSRQALNNLIHGQAGISPEMAIRLDKAFGGGAGITVQEFVALMWIEAGAIDSGLRQRRQAL
jgi:hypothetical protein